MKRHPGIIVLFLFLCLAAVGLTPAHATSTAYSEAVIDWATFSITLSNTDAKLSWDSQDTSSESWAQHPAYTDRQYFYNVIHDWTAITNTALYNGADGRAEGTGTATGDSLKTQTWAESSGSSYRADAAVYRYGEFHVTGDTTVTFSVNYSLKQILTGNSNEADAWSSAGFSLENFTAGTSINSGWDGTMGNSAPGTFTKDGTVSVSLLFDENDVGYLQAGVASPCSAKVPEPLTGLILGLGLLGLVGVKRKRQ